MLKFDINALFTIINLLLFYFLMKKFLFGRIKKVIDKRKSLIDEQLKKARDTNDEADKKLSDYKSKIANYKEEGDKIISDARDSAKTEYNKILDRAQNDADQLKDSAKRQIDEEREAARKASRDELASLAMQAAEKIVEKNVSPETDSAIFDEFLNESSDK